MSRPLPLQISVVCARESSVTRFIGHLAGLPEPLRNELVLVGGLAVTCRLAFAHRVTNDIDSILLNNSAMSLTAVLAGHGVVLDGDRIVFDDNTVLDVIEVADLVADDLPDNEVLRTFVTSHRWAYDEATGVVLRAVAPNVEQAHASVAMRVATPAALVAMKVQAAVARPRHNAAKAASDCLDTFLLLDRLDADGAVADALAVAPWGLATATAHTVRSLFVDEATVTAGRINRLVGPLDHVDATGLRRVGRRLAERVRARPDPSSAPRA